MRTGTKFTLWYLGLAIVIGVITVIVYRYFGQLAATLVVAIPLGLIANGWLAEWEDNQPGGFNNPLPPPKPKRTEKSPDA